MYDAVRNARALAPVVTAVVNAIDHVQVGHPYPHVKGLKGPVLLKVRYRAAPRWKIGAIVALPDKRTGHAIASAVAALLEVPVEYQMWTDGNPGDGSVLVAGAWANSAYEIHTGDAA